MDQHVRRAVRAPPPCLGERRRPGRSHRVDRRPRACSEPVIDINVSVEDVEDEARYLAPLAEHGYVLRVREPGHRMLRTPTLDVHVHVCAAGSDWERRHLLFRDWLIADDGDRDAYAELKRALAGLAWDDMNDYADAKGALVAEIMTRAEAWAARGRWTY